MAQLVPGVTFGDPRAACSAATRRFYVFSLPWLKFVQGWLFSSLVGVTFLTALAHYLWGGIRPQAPAFGEKVTPQVKAHLSVLLGPDHAREGVGVLPRASSTC